MNIFAKKTHQKCVFKKAPNLTTLPSNPSLFTPHFVEVTHCAVDRGEASLEGFIFTAPLLITTPFHF